MEIIEVKSEEYGRMFGNYIAVYNSPEFNYLNKGKTEEVKYFLFISGKVRLGLIAGINKNLLISPFSAPFGGFTCSKIGIGQEMILEAINLLENHSKKIGLQEILIVLPPHIYEESLISKCISSLFLSQFDVVNIDLNYHFNLSGFDTRYPDRLKHNARKNLRIAIAKGLQFRSCTAEQDKKKVYQVIKANREAKKYPLRMTYEQVIMTGKIVDSHFFLIEFEGTAIAAAIVFSVAPKIVQVIYWGDIPGHSALKPINFLSFKLFEYFHEHGIDIVDIGPSTENSVPNFGLCKFKEGIGCIISPKFSFSKRI